MDNDLINREALKRAKSLVSRYDFVSSPTEVVKVDEPVPNSDEINKALEKGEIYKRGFEDARKRFERPQGEWIIVKDEKWGDNVKCPFCGKELAGTDLNYCCKCGAELTGSEKINGGAE